MKLPLRNVTLSASFNAAGLLAGDEVANADDPNSTLYYWIGLGIVVGSAILSNLGVNVQKLSHVRVRHCHCCVMLACLSIYGCVGVCDENCCTYGCVFVWIFLVVGGRAAAVCTAFVLYASRVDHRHDPHRARRRR